MSKRRSRRPSKSVAEKVRRGAARAAKRVRRAAKESPEILTAILGGLVGLVGPLLSRPKTTFCRACKRHVREPDLCICGICHACPHDPHFDATKTDSPASSPPAADVPKPPPAEGTTP
jgi:hypothetical protein